VAKGQPKGMIPQLHAPTECYLHGMEQELRIQGSVAKLLLSMAGVGVSVLDPSSTVPVDLYST
jgi:hypothetical protein